LIVKGKYAGGGNINGAQDLVDFYDEGGINPLDEKGLIFLTNN